MKITTLPIAITMASIIAVARPVMGTEIAIVATPAVNVMDHTEPLEPIAAVKQHLLDAGCTFEDKHDPAKQFHRGWWFKEIYLGPGVRVAWIAFQKLPKP